MTRARGSLRGIVRAVTLAMVGLALAGVGVLAISTTLMHRATTRLSDATTGVRAAAGIEVNLMVHNVQSFLWLETRDPARRALRDAAARRLEAWLSVARTHAWNAEERAVIEEVERAARAHFANWAAIEESGVPSLEGFRRAAASLDPASSVAGRLVDLNLGQAREAVVVSERWNLISDVAGAALAVALVVTAAGGSFLLRRALYRPLLALGATMHRFASGDGRARADTDVPAELADVARDFNDLAESLQRQRAEQLAFVAAVAHDLKNPLTALKTGASLRVKPGDEAARERQGALIRRQVDRMDRMLGDFLDMAQVEAGAFELRPEAVDVGDAARSAVELFGGAAGTHELVVSAPPEPVWVRADPVRLDQVLGNLLSNAIKYSPDGGRVDVRVGRRDGAAVIEVEDHGIGIDPDDRERIWQPFRRLKSRSDLPGVGLGLAVTRKLVEGHGGRIGVDSAPGRGSTFRVELPAVG